MAELTKAEQAKEAKIQAKAEQATAKADKELETEALRAEEAKISQRDAMVKGDMEGVKKAEELLAVDPSKSKIQAQTSGKPGQLLCVECGKPVAPGQNYVCRDHIRGS